MIVVMLDRSRPSIGRVLGKRQRDRRHHVPAGDLVGLDQVEELLEVEPGHRDDRRPVAEAQVHHHDHPVDVEERKAADDHLAVAHLKRLLRLHQVGHEVACERASRPSAGRSCRWNTGGPPGRWPASIETSGASAGSASRSEKLATPSASPTTNTSIPTLAAASAATSRKPGTVSSRVARGVLQLVRQLLGRVERIGRGAEPAGAIGAVERDRVLGHVRHVHRQNVACAKAAAVKTGGERVDRADQLRVGQRPARRAVDQGRPVRMVSRVLEHERRDVHCRDLGAQVGPTVDHALQLLLGLAAGRAPLRAGRAYRRVRSAVLRSPTLTPR